MWREGDDWKVAFTVEYDGDNVGEKTPIGVDVGHNYILAAAPDDRRAESFLVSGKEHTFVRRFPYATPCRKLGRIAPELAWVTRSIVASET